MLRGIALDFKSAGHEVSILLDSRVGSLCSHFQADEVISVCSIGEVNTIMKKMAEMVDAAFVIAPEHDHVLQSIVELIETTNALSLNCGSKAIEQVSNKAALLEQTRRLGLDFPKTIKLEIDEPLNKITQSIRYNLGFPVVIKPLSGTGCSGLSIVRSENQLAQAIWKVKNETSCCNSLAQEYVQGTDASVSAICTCTDVVPLSLNLQELMLSETLADSSYTGGQVPFEHPLKTEAFNATKRLLTFYKGLRGYVGMDFVLTKDKAIVIEVNPRLTTSYIGLRRVINSNIAQAIIDSVLKQEIPENLENHGVAMFCKVPIRNQSISHWQNICGMQHLVSPPFPLDKDNSSCAMVESYSPIPNQAAVNLNYAKKQLHQILTSEE
jgi:tyramine---L-glutamate ligase